MIEAEMMVRSIRLTQKWYKDYSGDILAETHDGKKVRLVSTLFGSYRFLDEKKGKYIRVTAKNQDVFKEEAELYYRPLPKETSFTQLFGYMIRTLNLKDVLLILFATLMVTLVGVLYAPLSNLLYNRVIPASKDYLLIAIFMMFVGIAVTGILFALIKNYVLAGIEIRMSTFVEAAFYGRCVVLPASFYKKNPSGQISEWLDCIAPLCSSICTFVFKTGFSSLLSLLYIIQIKRIAPAMIWPTILIVFVFFSACAISAFYQTKWSRKQLQSNSRLTGLLYDLISGIEKIKLENAGERALKRWFYQYDEVSTYTYASPMFVRLGVLLPVLLSSLAGIVVLLAAKYGGLTPEEYMTFYAAFGIILGAAMSTARSVNLLVTVKPQYEMLRNILMEKPEYEGEDLEPEDFHERMDIEVKDISFGYEKGHYLFQNLSIRIPYGDYVALVGSTGCGKSTFLRLLLGFEKPLEGSVFYNGIDLKKQNPIRVRSKIGVVMQNDRLLPGSIWENMTMAIPDVTEEMVWEALEIAGIADDIRNMPMQLETLVGERNVFSGGQIQRIHIARAILSKPMVLIMDEATSALDNETQAKIAKELDRIKCTRIVVAHRLSTIQNCNRILVFDGGQIVEDGTYDQLLSKKGRFYELINRQLS